MIRTNRELAEQRLYDALDAEAKALCQLVPGLEFENIEEAEVDEQGEPERVKVPFTFSHVGRSPCLRDDLVETLLAVAAKLMGPGTHSQPAGDLWVDVKVRANRKVGE